MNGKKGCLALYWKSIFAVIVPIVLLPLILCNDSNDSHDSRVTKVTKWLYVVSIMIAFWITEALPHAITSFIPIALFPLLGVMDTVEICKLYAHETVFTFLGSLIIASSIEQCNLHKRIALKILCHVKCSHRRLTFVLMLVTMFISMWMQNFTVVVMMSRICNGILDQLESQGATTMYKSNTVEDTDEQHPTRITICYFLGVSYAATLGGCGSLLGTPTNLAFKGIFETYFPGAPEIDFLSFLLYSAPIMLLNTLLTWLWLQILLMGLFDPKSEDAKALHINERSAEALKENVVFNYKAMGRLTLAEIQVIILFVIFQFVLIFRHPGIMGMTKGWEAISETKIGYASPILIFVVLFFMVPNCFKCCRKTSDDAQQDSSPSLLTWTFVRRKIPWGLVFVLGAGIALTDSGKRLEIHSYIEDYFASFDNIPSHGKLLIVCLVCQIFTEFLSALAAANIILPILAELSKIGGKMNPLYWMFPATFSVSMAFHSSIGSPGNAYVAGLVNISKKDMFLCGVGPSVITLLTYWSTFPTYGELFYKDLTTFPEWASDNYNATANNATAT